MHKGESIRVFPISNWTELDIWQYIRLENIPIVPLYYAKERPVINLDGNIIMADDERLPEKYRDQIEMKMVRFRTLGCWPLTGAVESNMEAFHAGVGPFTHGSKVHTDLMKTQALLHALDKYKFDAAFGGHLS